MNPRSYQRDYSKHFKGVLDAERKTQQGLRFAAVLDAAGCRSLAGGPALDLGCSAGYNTRAMCRQFDAVVGFDLDEHAVRLARTILPANGKLLVADCLRLPFRSGVFKAILCSQIYEHVPDPGRMVQEMERVLADDGMICLGATNKWILLEPHYGLPLLSWLPRRWADWYLKALRGVDHYYENLLSYGQLKQLFGRFRIEDFSLRMIKNAKSFHCYEMVRPYRVLLKLPDSILSWLLPMFPSVVWILRKESRCETPSAGRP
jgi:SAM-dependent methyltransferase